MPGTTVNRYVDIGNQTSGYYSRDLLSHAIPVIVTEQWGLAKSLPARNTKVMEFRRSRPFAAATTPLTEGTAPDGSTFGYDSVQVTMQEYGDLSVITNQIEDFSKDNVLSDIRERQGEQIGATFEALRWDVLRAGNSVSYAPKGATGTTAVTARSALDKNSVFNVQLLRNSIRKLKRNKAQKIMEILMASDRYETMPIEACYVAFTHVDMESTLRGLTSFANNDDSKGSQASFSTVSRYGTMRPVSRHEFGSFEEARFLSSPDLAFFNGGSGTSDKTTHYVSGASGSETLNVYPTLIMGREYFGTIALRGEQSVHPVVVNPGTPSASDPLGQKGWAGWRGYFAAVVLNESWGDRIECVARQDGSQARS